MPKTKALGVLVVDDHTDARELLAEFLMHEGYHSIMAANGLEALARLEYIHPDVIVTDLDMPEMDGVELVRRLAESAEHKVIPIIILTGVDSEDARIRLADLGAHVRLILRKPVKLGALLEAVAALSRGDVNEA